MHALWSHIANWFTTVINPYWSPANLFAFTPPEAWYFERVYVVLTGLCLIAGITLLFIRTIRPGLRERFLSFSWTNFTLGLILFFFRYERIPLLGMDVWRFVQEVAMIIWIVLIYRYWQVKIPAERLAERVIAHKEKYLPKPKKS
jgi:hypothetical protein